MFGRFGWAEILVIVVLVLILFGSSKIPGMMKNLADGINTFKKEIKNKPVKNVSETGGAVKKSAKKPVNAGKVATTRPVVKKNAGRGAKK